MRSDYTAICSTFLLPAGTSVFEKRRFRSNYTIFWRGTRRRLHIRRGSRLISSVINQTRLRRKFNKEYQMLMLEAAEKHRIENMLKSTENRRAPARISDAGLTCLVEMRLKSTKKYRTNQNMRV